MEYRNVRVTAPIVVSLIVHLVAPAAAPASTARPVPRLALWIEVSANLPLLASRAEIARMLDRAQRHGVTDIIPEAKNAWGYVIYESDFAPHIRASTVPRTTPPVYDPPAAWFPQDIDPLEVLIEEAHARGIRVHAAVNVFGEALNAAGVGLLFDRPTWAAQHLAADGQLVPSTQIGTIGFANPVHPEVQLYELAVIKEVVANYAVDGLVLDRIRFPDAGADFSPLSRERFEAWLERPVEHWPDDVLITNGTKFLQGPLFPLWTAWRATVIQQFVRAAESIVHTLRPEVAFSAYVGGWYPTYWQEGVNWAAAATTPDLPWITPEWKAAAVAEMFDFLMMGIYFVPLHAADAVALGGTPWASVEGGAIMARDLVGEATKPVGSLLLSLYEGQPEQFQAALELVLRLHGGAMLFDLTYLDRYDWWQYLGPEPLPGPY